MRIGIFDSGLGGLIIGKAIQDFMPEYDYVYFGDTKRLPYGDKSHKEVTKFTCEAIDHLFEKENCALIVLACNTASSRALRKIQQEHLPKYWKDKKVLGVLIPAAEIAGMHNRIGIIATLGTVSSKTFPSEVKKVNGKAKIFQNASPLLVPFIEAGNMRLAKKSLLEYLEPLIEKNLECLVLGCTHYPILKKDVAKIMGKGVKVISQDEIIPKKLKSYLAKHREIQDKLSTGGSMKILVTAKTDNMDRLVKEWFGANKKVVLL